MQIEEIIQNSICIHKLKQQSDMKASNRYFKCIGDAKVLDLIHYIH